MKKLFFLIFTISLCSCETNQYIKQQNGRFLKTDKYNSGKLSSQQEFIKLENGAYVPDGLYLGYYENGKLSDSVVFMNGKKDGIERTYFESGSKKSITYYRQGILDSSGHLFHSNGKTAEWRYRKEGELLGLQFKLDTLEKPIYMLFSTPLDSLAFEIYFSSNSKIDKMVGTPLYVLEEKHNISFKDTYRVLNFVPQFGRIKAKLQIILTDGNLVLLNKQVITFEKLWNAHGYFFEYKFKKPGRYSYMAIVELFDSKNFETLKVDTVNADINITE